MSWELGARCPKCGEFISVEWVDGDCQGDEMEVVRDLVDMHMDEECKAA